MLFDGEKIECLKPMVGGTLDDEQINNKYSEGEIRIITDSARYPLDQVANMFSEKSKFNDLTQYQRGYVWNETKKSKLIESLIINIPIPPIFLYEVEYNKYEILDGKQRVYSIVEFYENKYKLEGLEVWNDLNGRYYRDLPDKVRSGLDRRYLSSIVMLNESSKDVGRANELKRMIFERLNTGGVKLTYQETRNAIYDGPFNNMCKEVVKTAIFKNVFSKSNNDHEIVDMSEVELVLRFFAFRQINLVDSRLNLFFDLYLEQANLYSDHLIQELKQLYLDTLTLAAELFDGCPFRLYKKNQDKMTMSKKFVKTIYDPMMITLPKYLDRRSLLIANKEEIGAEYIELFEKSEISFSGKLQHRRVIEERASAFDSIIHNVLL